MTTSSMEAVAVSGAKAARTPQEQFQALAPDAPLPWQEHPHRKGLILDANGEDVCWIDGSDAGWRGIAAMIVVAVNTCGGFKAELAPTPESAR